MGNHVLSIVVAFVAYTMLDLGKVFQKIGLAVMSTRRLRGIVIWLLASTATSASSLLTLYAVSLGSVLIVASMAGTGLAAVTLFSAMRMKERVVAREILAVTCIMAAPFLMGSVYLDLPANPLVVEHMFYSLAVVLAVLVLLAMVLRTRAKAFGILLALTAGALGGFMVLFQEISTTAQGMAASMLPRAAEASPGWVRALTNPYTAMWILLSLLSTFVLQVSYRHGAVIHLIPAFNGAYIVIPILTGVLILAEPLHPLQWAGVLLVLIGITILSSGEHGRSQPPR